MLNLTKKKIFLEADRYNYVREMNRNENKSMQHET